jgi:hypothetical protein
MPQEGELSEWHLLEPCRLACPYEVVRFQS